MSGELNREQYVPPVENQTHVPTDTTHATSDATTAGQNALLFGDNDLMGGITLLDQNVQPSSANLHNLELTGFDGDDDEDDEETISFDPDETGEQQVIQGPPQALPERPQPVTPQRIAEIITNLDSSSWRTRDQAQRDIQAAGAVALPQLLQAINNPPSLEVQRRAEGAVRAITGNMSVDQLLALRDPARRQQAIADGVTAPLNANDTQRINASLENAARSGIEGRLITPGWLTDLNLPWKGKLGDWQSVPSEASVSQYDRMATPEGRRQATQRLTELTQILASEHITNAERETISRQIADIGRAISPENIANGRVGSRMLLANYLSENGGDPNRIQALMLEAHRLSEGPGAAGPNGRPQGRDNRGGVLKTIINMGLDQNPGFMQRFGAQAGQGEVQEIQAMRAQIQEAERMQREAAQNPPPPKQK